MKNIDFYRKYSSDDRIPTLFGALMSLAALLLIVIFAGFELRKYLCPELGYKVGLAQSPLTVKENTVPLNFDIVFYKTPCARTIPSNPLVLWITRNNEFGLTVVNSETTPSVKLKRISSDLAEVADDYVSPDVLERFPNSSDEDRRLITQIIGKEGCRVVGSVKMYKCIGEIHFFITQTDNLIYRLGLNPREVRSNIFFSHKFESVTFGELEDQKMMVKLFGESSVTDFNKLDELPAEESGRSCFYFFSAVPHMFSIGSETIKKETYQYSLVSTCQSSYFMGYTPRIILAFDPTTIGISYHKDNWSILQMFTSFSAIIGGIYTIIGIIKRIVDSLM